MHASPSTDEIRRLFEVMNRGPYAPVAHRRYGAGLRLSERVRLRVKDLNGNAGRVLVPNGKGGKTAPRRPECLSESLRQHLRHVRGQHDEDCAAEVGTVALPNALAK